MKAQYKRWITAFLCLPVCPGSRRQRWTQRQLPDSGQLSPAQNAARGEIVSLTARYTALDS